MIRTSNRGAWLALLSNKKSVFNPFFMAAPSNIAVSWREKANGKKREKRRKEIKRKRGGKRKKIMRIQHAHAADDALLMAP